MSASGSDSDEDEMSLSDDIIAEERNILWTKPTLLLWSHWVANEESVKCTFHLQPKRGTQLTGHGEQQLASMHDDTATLVTFLVTSAARGGMLPNATNENIQILLLDDAKLGAEGTDFNIEVLADDMSMSNFARRPEFSTIECCRSAQQGSTFIEEDEE